MFAVDKIVQNVKIEKLLEHYGFNITLQEGDMARMACKIHGGDNPTSFAVNLETGLWFCHTGDCGGGDIFTLVERMERFTGKSAFSRAVEWVASFFDVDINNLEISERKSKSAKELENFMKNMITTRKKKIVEYNINTELRNVRKFRDFKSETLELFNLQYCETITLNKRGGGTYSLRNRLVFPIVFKGVQVGAILRRTKSSDVPKWSNQPLNLSTKDILYNYDATVGSRRLVICEGLTDVWAFHEIGIPAVATFGAHLTDNQYKLLLKTGSDLVFAYDGDEAGRLATQKALLMLKNKANLSVIKFEQGDDPASITREELLELYGKQERY